jgi:hypothetical protein
VGSVGELFGERGFNDGLLAGLVGFCAVLLVYACVRRRPVTVAGVAFAVAGAAAISGFGPFEVAGPFPGRVTVGLVLLAGAGWIVRWQRPPVIFAMALMAPGALTVAYGTSLGPPMSPTWVQPLIAIATAVGAALAADFDHAQRARALGPIVLAVSVGAVYATVPDTERAMVLVGASIVLLLASFPTPLSSLGPEGAAASVGLLLWVAAADGRGRPGSIVGAIGALALLVVEPLVRRIVKPDRRARRPENHLATVVLVALAQGALALYAARVAGFEDDGGRAALLLVPMVVAAVLISPMLPPPRSRAPRRRRGPGRHAHAPQRRDR